MKKILMIVGLAILAGGSVAGSIATVRAAEFMAPAAQGGSRNVTVGSTEEHKNLYIAGANVVVNGKTLGDLYAAGASIDVAGDVESDFVGAGGNISIDSKVGGDLRVAGGSVKISGPVGGDILAAGGSLLLLEKSSVGGDVVVAGGNVDIEAPVSGNVTFSGNEIFINNQIKGKFTITGVSRNQKITFGPKADVMGSFIIYGANASITKQDGAKVGDPEYRPARMSNNRNGIAKAVGGAVVIKLLAMIIAVLLLLHFFPRRTQTAVSSVMSEPWSNLGIGFVGLIVIPIVAIILAVILVGYYVALVLAAWYVFVLLLSMLVAALFVGAWIIKVLTKKPDLKTDWQAGVIGVVVLALLGFIPIVGWIACFILFCMGLGALLRMARADMKTNQ